MCRSVQWRAECAERRDRVPVVICIPICVAAAVTENLHIILYSIFNFHKNGHRKGRTFVMGTCDVYVSLLVKNDLVTYVLCHRARYLQADNAVGTAANLGIVIRLCQ